MQAAVVVPEAVSVVEAVLELVEVVEEPEVVSAPVEARGVDLAVPVEALEEASVLVAATVAAVDVFKFNFASRLTQSVF